MKVLVSLKSGFLGLWEQQVEVYRTQSIPPKLWVPPNWQQKNEIPGALLLGFFFLSFCPKNMWVLNTGGIISANWAESRKESLAEEINLILWLQFFVPVFLALKLRFSSTCAIFGCVYFALSQQANIITTFVLSQPLCQAGHLLGMQDNFNGKPLKLLMVALPVMCHPSKASHDPCWIFHWAGEIFFYPSFYPMFFWILIP